MGRAEGLALRKQESEQYQVVVMPVRKATGGGGCGGGGWDILVWLSVGFHPGA